MNGDTTLGFLLHEVSGCLTVMHLTRLMNLPSQLQNSLSGGRLTSIHVSEDTDVAVTGKVCHVGSQIRLSKSNKLLVTTP